MTTPFVVSMTSYQPRFDSLPVTLENILTWELLPEKIYLNLTPEDLKILPKSIFDAGYSYLLRIKEVVDLGPSKKLIPTLLHEKKFPIVTIDDDLIYDPNLIIKILVDHLIFPTCIIAGRTHLITRNEHNQLNGYMEWEHQQRRENGPSNELFPTGGGMTLFPQGSLHDDVVNMDLLRSVGALYTDDIWHFFQARRNGTLVRQISERYQLNCIEGTQAVGLWRNGNQVRNDLVISELLRLYGDPCNL
jgi:hypothetical protein